MIGFAAERLMEPEVGAATGAVYGEKGPARLARRSGYLDRDWVDEGQKTVRGTVFPRRARRGGRTAHPQAHEGQVLPGVSGTKADGGDRARERHWSERAGAG